MTRVALRLWIWAANMWHLSIDDLLTGNAQAADFVKTGLSRAKLQGTHILHTRALLVLTNVMQHWSGTCLCRRSWQIAWQMVSAGKTSSACRTAMGVRTRANVRSVIQALLVVLLLDMIAPGGLLLKHTHGVCSHANLQSCHSAPMQGLQSCVEETASWYRSWKRRDCSQTALFLLCAQIRCGDLYAGKVVEEFNSCAITKHNCVAARVDVNKYPEPRRSRL